MDIQKKSTNKDALLFILLIIYPFIFIWQGGDLTDNGFLALHYQSFFTYLSFGEVNALIILSNLIGALWLKLLPNMGIVGLKIFWLLIFYTIIYLSYSILKDFTKNKSILLIGIFCSIAFSTRTTTFVFSYDLASFFFLILMAFFLIKHYFLKKDIYLFISGMMLFLAFIARFSNIVALGIIPFFLIYEHFYKSSNKKVVSKIQITLKQYFLFCLGFFSLSILFYAILKLNGIWDVYIANVESILNASTNVHSKDSHSIFNILKKYSIDFIRFYPHLIIVTFLIVPLSRIFEFSKRKNKIAFFLIPVSLLFILAFLSYRGFSYSSTIKYFIPAFCMFPLLFSIISKDKFSVTVFIISAITIIQVAGTNTGLFYKLYYGFIVLIPLSLLILYENKEIYLGDIKITTKPIYITGVCFILFFSLWARMGWIYHVDVGLGSRMRCIYPIENEQMKGIFTTKENAQHIKSLCKAIKSNIKENNTLFIYGHQPMFYYLTNQIPPVKKFWLTNNVVQVDELFQSLEESIINKRKFPMIVDTKQNIMGEVGQKKLDIFLYKYHYYGIEDKKDYKIWVTNENKKAHNI